MNIGRRAGASGYEFSGRIDDVRIANHALTQDQIQTDMVTPLGAAPGPDTVAPSVPTGLAATPVSTTQINLSWNASTDNVGVTGYQVFRNGQQIATTTTTSFSNTGLTPATTYQYAVRASDAAGNTSALTTAVSATTPAPDTTAPTVALTAPNAATPLSGTVAVSANAADNVGVVGVQFLLDGAALGAEDTATPYSVSWDTTTAANGNHVLRARARDAAGNSTSTPLTVTVSNTQVAGFVAGYAFNETAGTTTSDASGHGTDRHARQRSDLHHGREVRQRRGPGWRQRLRQPRQSHGAAADRQHDGQCLDLLQLLPGRRCGDRLQAHRGGVGFQLDTTIDTGARTIGFKLTNSSGGQMFRYGATTLQPNTWYYVTGVYDATAQTMDVYLNGQLDNGVLQGTVTATQQNSTANVTIGRRAGAPGTNFPAASTTCASPIAR